MLITAQLYLDLTFQCFRPEAGQIQSQIFIFKQHKDISIHVSKHGQDLSNAPTLATATLLKSHSFQNGADSAEPFAGSQTRPQKHQV